MSIKSISSRENPLYKELKQLASSAQARRKATRTLLDGIHLCESYLQTSDLPSLCVVSASSLTHVEVAPLVNRCDSTGVQCIILPDQLYSSLSQIEHGVGLLFVIEIPQSLSCTKLTQSSVLLDRLQDPGNLGSLLRSAAAAGISDVFCAPGTAHAWSPKVLRAGMGAHFALRIFENADLLQLISASAMPVLATSSHAKKSLYEMNLIDDVAWLFGHEGQGAQAELLEHAHHQIGIPHLGKIESLNVAASAAVCFFEQARQRLTLGLSQATF